MTTREFKSRGNATGWIAFGTILVSLGISVFLVVALHIPVGKYFSDQVNKISLPAGYEDLQNQSATIARLVVRDKNQDQTNPCKDGGGVASVSLQDSNGRLTMRGQVSFAKTTTGYVATGQLQANMGMNTYYIPPASFTCTQREYAINYLTAEVTTFANRVIIPPPTPDSITALQGVIRTELNNPVP